MIVSGERGGVKERGSKKRSDERVVDQARGVMMGSKVNVEAPMTVEGQVEGMVQVEGKQVALSRNTSLC